MPVVSQPKLDWPVRRIDGGSRRRWRQSSEARNSISPAAGGIVAALMRPRSQKADAHPGRAEAAGDEGPAEGGVSDLSRRRAAV